MNNYINMEFYDSIHMEECIMLDTFIIDKKNEFLSKIETEIAKKSIYDLSYDIRFYKNIASLHYILYVDSGGAHSIRYDKVFYYDLVNNKELFLEDLITNKDEFLKELSTLSEYLLKEKKNLLYDDVKMVKTGLTPTIENFSLLIFLEDNLEIIFPPYQVGPWSSGAISIKIPYLSIENYLKV